jgi:hypothetical protein
MPRVCTVVVPEGAAMEELGLALIVLCLVRAALRRPTHP